MKHSFQTNTLKQQSPKLPKNENPIKATKTPKALKDDMFDLLQLFLIHAPCKKLSAPPDLKTFFCEVLPSPQPQNGTAQS